MAESSIRMRRKRFASFHPLRRTRDEIPDTSSNSSYLTRLSPFVSDTHDPLPGLNIGAVGGTGKMDSVDDACAVCGSGGTLLLCSKCPLAFHFSCVGPPLRNDLNENWACRRCSYPPLDAPVNATTPAPIIEDIKDTPTQSKDTKEERFAATSNKIKTEPGDQVEFTSITAAFAAMADHANAGNPLVFVLPNDIMDLYLQQSQKFDWLRCNNCGKLRRVKDGLVSECLLADWTCSQPYWKTEYGTCARPEDRGCRAVKDAKEHRQVQRQVDFVYEYGPVDIPRSRLTFPDKSSSATPERASKRNSIIARVTQLEAENGVVLGEPEFPAEKVSELLEVDMETILNKLADILAKDYPSSQKVILKPSTANNFNSANLSANNKDMIKMAGMKVNAMPPRSGSGVATFGAPESSTPASSIAPPAAFYGNTQQSQTQQQPKKLTAISVGTSDRYLAANKAAGTNLFAPKLIAPPVVRLTQDESRVTAMGTAGAYTSNSSKIAPPLAAAAAAPAPGPVSKTGGSAPSPIDKLKGGAGAPSTSTSEDSAKKARNAAYSAATASQQRKNRNSDSEAMNAVGKDRWTSGPPHSGGWNPASLPGTGSGMPVHGGPDPNMGMVNPHYGTMPHHMRQPPGPPSQPAMGPFGGVNHPMPGQLPVDPKTGMSANTNMAFPPGGQPPPGGPYPGDPKMDRQFAPNQGHPGQFLGPNQSAPGRGGPGRMPDGYGPGAPPPSGDADGNLAKAGSNGATNGSAADPSNKRKFMQMQGPEEGYPSGPPRYDYGYFPPEMGPGVGPYGMPPGPGPANRYAVYPPYVDPMTGLPYGDPRAGPYRDPNAPPMYPNMYDPRAIEYGGPQGPPPSQGGRRQGLGGSSPNNDDVSRQRGRYDDFYFQGANRPGPGMNMPPGAPPGSSGPYAQGPQGIEGGSWPGPTNQPPPGGNPNMLPGMNPMRGGMPGGSSPGGHYMSAEGMLPYGPPPTLGLDPDGRPYGQPPSQPPAPSQQGPSQQQQRQQQQRQQQQQHQQQQQQQQQDVPPHQGSSPLAPSSLVPAVPGTSNGSSVSSKELISKIAQLGFSMEDEDALIELALANNRDLFVLYEAFGATPDRFMRHALTLSKGRRTGAQ